jgi:starch synthase
MAERLARRHFVPLASAPTTQCRLAEIARLFRRAANYDQQAGIVEANKWVMRTMARKCAAPRVTAVHGFEDSSLWQFHSAKRLGKACIYNIPVPHYPVRERIHLKLNALFADWVSSSHGLHSLVGPEHKRGEIELADIIIVPSGFAERSIRETYPDKAIVRAPYGIDTEFWTKAGPACGDRPLRFVYAGHLSVAKGIPLLINAWECADLPNAELELIGPWRMAPNMRQRVPKNVVLRLPCSAQALRERYQSADVFVFPSFYEGFGMVLLEAMACGLPVVASDATAAQDILTSRIGVLTPSGSLEALVEGLRWCHSHRDKLKEMGEAARELAVKYTWAQYRRVVTEAVEPFA